MSKNTLSQIREEHFQFNHNLSPWTWASGQFATLTKCLIIDVYTLNHLGSLERENYPGQGDIWHLWRMIDVVHKMARDQWTGDAFRQNIFPPQPVKYTGLGNIWPEISKVLLLARLGGLTWVPCWSQINLLYWPHLTRYILPGWDWLTLTIWEKPEIPGSHWNINIENFHSRYSSLPGF